jgi:import receptor subunit TOM22
MVQLVEVPDEHFDEKQAGDDDDAYYTDTDSSISDSDADSVSDAIDESLIERLTALKDIIPPRQRAAISSTFKSTYGWVTSGLSFGGKTLWVLSTSALLLGVPYVLAFTEEQQIVEMEKEVKMQQNLNEVKNLSFPGLIS